MDNDSKKALEEAVANCKAVGVGTLNVKDGQVFLFSKATLEDLLKSCIESGEDMTMIHVRIPGKMN